MRLWSLVLVLATAIALPVISGTGAGHGQLMSWHDGDTATVHIGGRVERVRLIGVDAPESSVGPRALDQARRLGIPLQRVVRLGLAARQAAEREAPPGRRVRLELDVQARDRYGRLLAYLWAGPVMVNERLAELGWAVPYTVPPNVRYAERLVAAGRRARERGLGLWGAGGVR